MNKKHRVRLTSEERTQLEQLIRAGRSAAATQSRARILLKADGAQGGPGWADAAIAEALEVSVATVERTRKRFAAQGLAGALRRKPTTRAPQWKLDGAQEARLVTLACSAPPTGAERWTLALLAERLVELRVVEALARDTVRVALKKRAQAVAETDLEDPAESPGGVRGPDGGRAGWLCPPARPAPAAGLLR